MFLLPQGANLHDIEVTPHPTPDPAGRETTAKIPCTCENGGPRLGQGRTERADGSIC